MQRTRSHVIGAFVGIVLSIFFGPVASAKTSKMSSRDVPATAYEIEGRKLVPKRPAGNLSDAWSACTNRRSTTRPRFYGHAMQGVPG